MKRLGRKDKLLKSIEERRNNLLFLDKHNNKVNNTIKKMLDNNSETDNSSIVSERERRRTNQVQIKTTTTRDEKRVGVNNDMFINNNICERSGNYLDLRKQTENKNPFECIISRKTNYNPFEGVKTLMLSKYGNNLEYNNTLVVLSYNVDFNIIEYREKYPNYKIVIYQLEQLYDNKSQWYNINSYDSEVVRRTKHIQKSLGECDEIWDYDLDNINFLKNEGFKNIIHVPLDFTSELMRVNNIENPQYDILFLGSINDKRAKILSILHDKYKISILAPASDIKKYSGYNFGKNIHPSIFDNSLYNYIFNAKIIVNLHYYESHLQEQVRLFELLINNKVIVSEKSIRNYFGDLIYEFETQDEMINIIDKILDSNSWKNQNISERFRLGQYKRFKVGVAYNTYYGLELIEKSIKIISKCVDYIVIVHQKVGFNGKPEPEHNEKILKRLTKNKLINNIVYYDNNNSNVQQGVLEKRNIGLEFCKKNGCTYIIPMDSDERYNPNELINEINFIYDNNIDTLYSPIYSYYYDENHYFKDTYYVASAFKIDNRKFKISKSSVLVDPVRKMEEGVYKISDMYMHHYTYLKNSFGEKINNSVASTTDESFITVSMKKIYKQLQSWKEGNDVIVFANDLKNGGIVLKKVNLTRK